MSRSQRRHSPTYRVRREDAPARTRNVRSREIALLGGSFNPPHVAHMMAAYWALVTQQVSEVWLLPAYKHPFGKMLAPFDDRVQMCKLASAELRHVRVCEAEAELSNDPLVGKTVRILEHLTSKYRRVRFAWIIGTDVLDETEKWYRWDRVQELARIIVVGRSGHAADHRPELVLPDISSSKIRGCLARGGDVSDVVPSSVVEYIATHRLYR